MKGEVPAKGTSPFFLIIIKFGTFFTHFEMILAEFNLQMQQNSD